MDLHEWLDEEGAPRGRATRLSEALGVSKAAVSLWRSGGVPLNHMERIQELTSGVVTVADMAKHAAAARRLSRSVA